LSFENRKHVYFEAKRWFFAKRETRGEEHCTYGEEASRGGHYGHRIILAAVRTFNSVLECGDLSPLSHFLLWCLQWKNARQKIPKRRQVTALQITAAPLGGEGLPTMWQLCNMLREDIVVSANGNVSHAGAASVLDMLKPMLVTP
jgi:hypothetical protein